jgi:phage shock protein A
MEEFRDIRNYAKIALNENAPMTYLIKEWKDDIRDMLQTVQEDFIRMIRDYTRKFYNSLVKIEQQSVKLLPFENEDTRQWERLETMKVKYEQIEAIIKRVDATAPNHKA